MRVVLLAFFAVSLAAFASAQSFAWKQSPANGNLYAVTQPMTWQQARSQALALGGDLTVVRSAEEQAWLFDQFGGPWSLWIGYTDAAVEGTWVWTSGSAASYTNWAPGQPDNQGGAENWAAISPQNGWPLGAGGQWLDLSANFVCPGIIELEPAAVGRAISFGNGCAGSNGAPELAAVGAAPVPGSWFPVRFDRLPLASTFVLVGLGLPRAGPLDLTSIGMPGCEWYLDHFFVTVVNQPSATGTLNWSFLVLNNPILRGVQLRTQGVVADPPANAVGATVSNALAMVYGQGVGTVAMCESFLDDTNLDRPKSGGTWDSGMATFAAIGGDGRHGIFSAMDLGAYVGVIGGLDTYVIDTDNTTVPAVNTLSGLQELVTDSRYFFDEMVVPATVRLRFVGSVPPRFTVAGRLEVLGEIDVQGETLPYPASSTAPFGQSGGVGGVFGGNGGKGGDKCLGNGPSPLYDGEDGQSAHVLGGRAYAATANGTGGKGSTLFPASGSILALYFAPGTVTYTPDASAGGGGGGLWTAGQASSVTNNHNDPLLGVPPRLASLGPIAPGGTAVQFFPFPATSGSTDSSVHFLVGGSGGGAAASNAALAINVARQFAAGGGGGGGGGAMALRAGDALSLGALARVLANGGSGGSITSSVGATAAPAPGGGGSGGTVLLQSARTAGIVGVVNVLGGRGGTYDRQAGGAPPTGARVQIAGGDGSDGFLRFEVSGTPSTAMLPNVMPPAMANNVAPLLETDPLVSSTSTFYDLRLELPPRFVRYEIDAEVDGVPVIFSDDPAISNLRAAVGAPLRAYFQAAHRAPITNQVEVAGPWRTAVRSSSGIAGIDIDTDGTMVRFRIVQDRALAITVVVKSVRVVYDI